MRIIPSIEFIPGKSNVGSALSVIGPDFTFSRTTTPVAGVATRVNASGLIETVPDNVLRLDYPIGGGCPAALIEPAATNLAPHSENFAASGFWALTNATINTNNDIAPDGTMTADTLSATSNSAQVQGAIVGVSGTTYTVSIYIKRRTGTGIVYLRSVENINTPITITNDWTRVYLTATATTTVVRIGINLATSGDEVDLWGAQLETGAIPTSYIPTTTGSATRNADVCSVSGVSGYIGQTEGTIYAEVDARNFIQFGRYLTINDGTTNNSIELRSDPNKQLQATIISSGNTVFNVVSTGTPLLNGQNKLALAYDLNNVAFYVNGTLISSSTSVVPTSVTLTSINIGSRALGGSLMNDRIRAAAIYTTRLSNDQLASLTRLT